MLLRARSAASSRAITPRASEASARNSSTSGLTPLRITLPSRGLIGGALPHPGSAPPGEVANPPQRVGDIAAEIGFEQLLDRVVARADSVEVEQRIDDPVLQRA